MRLYFHILLIFAGILATGFPATAQELAVRCQAAVEPKVVLTLGQCESMALDNNTTIRNSRLDVDAARAQKQEAFAEYFPKVSFNVLGYWAPDPLLEINVKDVLGNSDMANNINAWIHENAPLYGINTSYSTLKNGYSMGLSLVQPVFAGGRIVTGNRLASLGIEAAELQNSIQVRKSREEIEQNYWQIVSLEEKIETVDEVGKMLDNLHKDLSSAIKAGVSVSTDMLQLQLKQNELASSRAALVGGIRLAKMNLLNSIGLPYTPYSTINPDNLPYIDDICLDRADLDSLQSPEHYWRDENEVAASREEARLLSLAVDAKRAEKRMVLGEVLPQAGVGATYGYGSMIGTGRRFSGVFFATLKVPITDWGKYSRKLQRYEYQVQKAENDRNYLREQLLLQVRQQWFQLTVEWEKLQIAVESENVSRAAMRQQENNYKAGLVPLSALLEAQTALRQSADAAADACIAYRNALVTYRR